MNKGHLHLGRLLTMLVLAFILTPQNAAAALYLRFKTDLSVDEFRDLHLTIYYSDKPFESVTEVG